MTVGRAGRGENGIAIRTRVLLVWRRTHEPRYVHDARDTYAQLHLHRGDVQRVAHASLQLAGAVVLVVVVHRLVSLGRSRLAVGERRVLDRRGHAVLAARDRGG